MRVDTTRPCVATVELDEYAMDAELRGNAARLDGEPRWRLGPAGRGGPWTRERGELGRAVRMGFETNRDHVGVDLEEDGRDGRSSSWAMVASWRFIVVVQDSRFGRPPELSADRLGEFGEVGHAGQSSQPLTAETIRSRVFARPGVGRPGVGGRRKGGGRRKDRSPTSSDLSSEGQEDEGPQDQTAPRFLPALAPPSSALLKCRCPAGCRSGHGGY